MARRKGVSKSRNSGARKLITESSSSSKQESKLKNDPVEKGHRDMDESELISKKVSRHSEDYQRKSGGYVNSLSHRNTKPDQILIDNPVNITQSETTNSIDFINSNNNNSKTFNNTSNKYLHKKFKRIASATINEAQSNKLTGDLITVTSIVPKHKEESSKSIQNADSQIENFVNADNSYSLNGHRVNIQVDSGKNQIVLNGESNEGQRIFRNSKLNSPKIHTRKSSPCTDDNSSINSLPKSEKTSLIVNANHNNNVLNRVSLITSNCTNSSNSSSSSPISTTVIGVGTQQRSSQNLQSQRVHQREVLDQNFSGRHVCPYCNLNCTKPSVLQKHIRAHTNERPYPCDTCGFAFKTKSNYYKHCRSRSHALRTKGGEAQPDDEGSIGSDQDPELSNSSSDVISRTASPMDERTSSPAIQQQAVHQVQKCLNEKPYKPKFHNAALYAKEEISQQQKQLQHQYQQYNSHTHQNQMGSNYYPHPQYSHQHRQQQEQHETQEQHLHFQHQTARIRLDLTPPTIPSQNFQQAPLPGCVDTTPSSSCSSIREPTSSSFNGIAIAVGGHQLNREFLQEHISKIISQNEAIVENKEILLQKKYPKISGKSKSSVSLTSNEGTSSKLAFALASKQQHSQGYRDEVSGSKSHIANNSLGSNNHASNSNILTIARSIHEVVNQVSSNSETLSTQPLNLSKIVEQAEIARKRSSVDSYSANSSESTSSTIVKTGAVRPQTQERSIIKHLLLNARGLGVPNGEGEDAVYTCPLCKMDFRSAEDLRLHTSNYCQGGPSSAPISPVASPSYKYFRSNSINVNLPEFNNPNSLAKLARSSLLHLSRNPLSLAKLAWSQLKTKPSNLVLNQLNVNTNTTTANTSGNCDSSSCMSSRAIDTPLPSPGPLLGKTPLIEAYNNSERKSEDVIITKVHDEQRVFTKDFSPKRLKLNNFSVSCEGASSSGRSNASGYNIASTSFEGNQVKIQPSQQTFAMCGGDVQLLEKREDRMKRFHSSGGCMIPISECPDIEMSPKMIRTPLLSGGSFSEVLAKSSGKDSVNTPSTTPKMMIPIAPLTPSVPGPNLLNAGLPLAQHFQFPPINSITAFNPLTLPPIAPTSVLHGDKLIPFVPGIPGPNTLPPSILHPQITTELQLAKTISSTGSKTKTLLQNSIGMQPELSSHHVLNPRHQVIKPIIRIENDVATPGCSSALGDFSRTPQKSSRHWPSTVSTTESAKKSFNFTRMADNLSPRKPTFEKLLKSTESEQDRENFNSDASSKADITSTSQLFQSHQLQHAPESTMMPLHVDVTSNNIVISKDSSEYEISESKSKVKSKFLRPTSLPLKPGTFTPKRHHGITPTANTLPLISPETPRPSKACIQLYLNGHAYTYLGLKCSTKMFYCTVNCPQPSYVANLHKLSMYSVWQVCAENNPHPLGLKPKTVMSLYDSRQRISCCTTAKMSLPYTTVHSQSTVMTPFESIEVMGGQFYHHQVKAVSPCSDAAGKIDSSSKSNSNVLVGGYESNEDYTYIRGRGRGRYVCSECGIRCKKPSMLKKHIRTHTDVRPYTCQHCSFSFKTKGNLTKHMQSKTHYKKCLELGISPGPMLSEGDYMDTDGDTDQQSTISGGGRTSSIQGESDTDDYSDIGDNETESSDTDESKSRLLEHEAARCLLSLSMTPPVMNSTPGRTQYGSYRQQTLSSESGTGRAEESSAPGFTSKRVISFTSPKPPFDYQKQEQYYSNPSIPKNRDEKFDELSMKPIDLTKPRQVSKYKLSDIIGDLSNETSLLKSLVSITDMVRNNTESMSHKVDESVLLQAYLTEQALKYTKIKQSQMSRSFAEISNGSTLSTMTTAHTKTVNSNFSQYCDLRSNVISYSEKSSMSTVCITTDSLTQPIAALIENEDVKVKKEVSISNSSFLSTTESRRETSLSPSISQPDLQVDLESKPPVPGNPSLPLTTCQLSEVSKDISISPRPRSLPPGTGGAKSVASEYLKMTSAEYLKSRGNRTEDSEESSSDQEIAITDTPPSTVKPPTEFTGVLARTVIVGEDGFKSSSSEVQPMFPRVPLSDDGRPVCTICSKTFQKQHQMVLHMNIHYMERKFKCEPCAVSFRTQGHLQKHERSEAHKNKVMMTSTFGVPTTSNPRPFECSDCKVAFRIHGHLAKHLRSKTHVQKLECLQKLPFGTYAEIERAGISLTEIDTTDCDNSLASLKALAQKLIEKDPNKLNSYNAPSCIEGNLSGGCSYESGGEDSPRRHSDGGDAIRDINELSMIPLRSSTEGSGVKRKLESFSSCSNDSMMNAFQQQDIVQEKRPRTTSET